VITRGGRLTEYVEKIRQEKKASITGNDESTLISPPALKRFPLTQSLKVPNS